MYPCHQVSTGLLPSLCTCRFVASIPCRIGRNGADLRTLQGRYVSGLRNVALDLAARDSHLVATYSLLKSDEDPGLPPFKLALCDDVVHRHAACGTPHEVRARIEEYRAIGLDEVVLGGLDDAAAIASTLKAING